MYINMESIKHSLKENICGIVFNKTFDHTNRWYKYREVIYERVMRLIYDRVTMLLWIDIVEQYNK